MNEPAGGALHQTDSVTSVSAVRIHSHQLTIIQMKQNNKKSLSTFICLFAGAEASFRQRYSNRPLSHDSHVRTDNADDQCVLMLSSPLSVSNRPTLWLTAHYLQPNTNNNLQWRVTFRNLNAWLLPVPCVRATVICFIWALLHDFCCLLDNGSFTRERLLFLQVVLTHDSLHLCSLSKVAQMFMLFLADELGAALLVYVLQYEFGHLKISEHQCFRY